VKLPSPILVALAASWLLVAPAQAAAEIYRWRDAQGREHFTTNLQQVPASQREAARRAAEQADSRVNYHTPPPARGGAARPAKSAAPPPAPAAQGPQWNCSAVRRKARELRKTITYHRNRIEADARRADDITRNAYSRRKYEARGEESAEWLAKAETAYERFTQEQRRKGVPPGCLRP
jgi:hypothetical protein